MNHRTLLTAVVGLVMVMGPASAGFGASPAAVQDPTHPTGYDGYHLVRITIANPADLQTLRRLETFDGNFEISSKLVRVGLPLEVVVSPQGQQTLDNSGLNYEVVIADFQAHLDTIFAGAQESEFFDSLRTYDEHVQFMTDLAAQYPDLAEMFELGQSVQGRSMWALRITGPSPGRVKPAVFYHGAQHGNEAAGASVVAFGAHHLLTNYDSDPDVAALTNNVEWFLLPISNPDGYIAYTRRNANNVNLNRNWGGPGSGQAPDGGPYPWSEPETQAMRDLLLDHPTVRVHIDYHGYVPWLMWAWGHTPDLCPDHDLYLGLGAQMRDLIEDAGGGTYEIGNIYDVAYWVSGGSTDYVYGEAFRHSFALELNHSQMPRICNEFLGTMLLTSEWIAETDCNANSVDDDVDIAVGTSQDENNNGVPDECEGVVCPAQDGTVALLAGLSAGGSSADICSSDDVYWTVQTASLFANVSPPPVEIELTANVTITDGSEIRFIAETAATEVGVVQQLNVFNYTTGDYESSVAPDMSTSDTVYTVARSNVSDYISGGQVKFRLAYLRPDGVPPFWKVNIDGARIEIDP